ncbi:MAG: hypothetical protein M3Y18_03690 [Candidatus Eremiobacteraeota bacterium]|nr:hypothetical protein [Candidatus Eremiobacteraeota bacterium]
MSRIVPFLLILAGLAGSSVPVSAQNPALDGHTIVVRMIERNPSLRSFRARVHVNVHMKSFPFLSPTLDGTSYFRRPDNYEVVFDRVPGYAKGFSKLFNDIGDPASWERDQSVQFEGMRSLNGRSVLVLRLAKKIHSDQLADTVAYVDPTEYTVAQMEWHYRNGGAIVMTQSFRSEGPYSVISSQHAIISIPHVRAVADSAYAAYQTNVAVDTSVFTQK